MILVYLEHDGEKLLRSSLSALTAAHKAKSVYNSGEIVGVVLADSKAPAEDAARYGIDRVISVINPQFNQFRAVHGEEAIVQVMKEVNASIVIAASTGRAKDLMPRVAQKLGAGQATDVLEFFADGSVLRPMYAGNILAEVEITTSTKVFIVRPTAFEVAKSVNSSSPIQEMIPNLQMQTEYISFEAVKSERPQLGDATVVVSGGRALKSAENFETVLSPLADALGAAIGASRAAVDSGYAPNDWQVGQTGKVVAPQLYIAVGISGAIQHLAGMKDSKVIVAINKDPEAAIFEVADYGLVGDLFELVPKLTACLKI